MPCPTALRAGVREFGCRGIAARAGALAFRPIAVYVLQVHSNLASTGEGTCPRSPFQQLEVRSTQFPDTLNGFAWACESIDAPVLSSWACPRRAVGHGTQKRVNSVGCQLAQSFRSNAMQGRLAARPGSANDRRRMKHSGLQRMLFGVRPAARCRCAVQLPWTRTSTRIDA